MQRITKKLKWGPFLAALLLLCLIGTAAADNYVGGQVLTTVKTGTVSGGLYMDDDISGPYVDDLTKTFSPIPNVDSIQWARLYVSAYSGHMQESRHFEVTTYLDGDNDGDWDDSWTESADTTFTYMVVGDPPTLGGNNNTAQGGGAHDPYLIVNDHMNRVTSDYLMWYDVTGKITSTTPKVRVDATASYDGRIKILTLIVAYNDGDTDEIHYWVNQGHDVDSYYSDDSLGEDYIGVTSFDLAGVTGTVDSATLRVNHMASSDGSYKWNGNTIPTNPPVQWQGSYSGGNTWDVTSSVNPGSSNALSYDRTGPFYKIPLATLAVKIQGAPPVQKPDADFSATPLSGTAPLNVAFTDLSSNTPTSWAWDFQNDGTDDSTLQSPSYTYSAAGTYTVKLTATNAGGSDTETKTDYITVSAAPSCDLTPTLVNPDTGNVFAREPNRVRVNVKNNGPQASPATEVRLTSTDGVDVREAVPAIASGATATVYVTDPTSRDTEGGSVTYTATVDPDNAVAETNEGNNVKASTAKTVKYNGYKGKRYWTGASDVTTKKTFDLRGGILYSAGDSTYHSGGVSGGGWSSYTVTWTAGDLPLPAGATVREARLYVPYTWDDTGQIPDHFHLSFNGVALTPQNHYEDRSNFGGYPNHDYGLLTYDVTALFNPAGNTASLAKDDVNTNVAMYGLTLAVVYEDASATRKQIFLNEEFDILGADATNYATTPEEATAYVPFSGMTIVPTSVTHAYLTTFVPAGNGPEGDLLWNGATLATNVWDHGPLSGTQVAVDTRDVAASLQATGNEAGIRNTPGNTPVMAASHAFFVVEYAEAPPVAAFTGTPRSGDAPLEVVFDSSASTGVITGYAWDFDNDGDTDSTAPSPTYTYSNPGTYTVKLTVSGPGGSDDEVKTDYIVVNAAAPATIEVTLDPGTVSLSPMIAGQDATGSTTVNVEVSGGTSWSVAASDGKTTNKGYMVSGSTPLVNPFQLGKDGGAFQALTSDYTSFMSGNGMGTFSATASLKQPVVAGDQVGDYAITITFTGSCS